MLLFIELNFVCHTGLFFFFKLFILGFFFTSIYFKKIVFVLFVVILMLELFFFVGMSTIAELFNAKFSLFIFCMLLYCFM